MQRFLPSRPTTSFAILLGLFCLIFTACIDEVQFPLQPQDPLVFVDGLISDSLDTYQIRLGYSARIGEGNDNILVPIEDATISVSDDSGAVVPFSYTGDDGLYRATMQAERGRSYQLQILLADGRQIVSEPQMLPAAVAISSIESVVETREYLNTFNNLALEQRLNLLVSSPIAQGEQVYLRWRVRGEYEFHEGYPNALNTRWCYVPDRPDLNQLHIFDSRLLGADTLRGQRILETDYNYRFAIQYCAHVQQYSMSEQEYRYWQQIQLMLNRSGSLFDPPPGNVRGNLSDPDDPGVRVLGFFSVSDVSYYRYFVNRDRLDVYVDERCRFRFRDPIPEACMNCLTLNGSTLLRPDYWIP